MAEVQIPTNKAMLVTSTKLGSLRQHNTSTLNSSNYYLQ